MLKFADTCPSGRSVMELLSRWEADSPAWLMGEYDRGFRLGQLMTAANMAPCELRDEAEDAWVQAGGLEGQLMRLKGMMAALALVTNQCFDCKEGVEDEHYCLKDEVWEKVAPEPDGRGLLCIYCAEKRLGRMLTSDDFRADVPINEVGPWSDVLNDRLTRKAAS